MEKIIEEAKNGLKFLVCPENTYLASWGFRHILTNGEILETTEMGICFVKLRISFDAPDTNGFETDCEEYFNDLHEEALLAFLKMISKKVLNMKTLESCEYIFRKLKERFPHKGVTVAFGRDLHSIESKPFLSVNLPLDCHFGKAYQIKVFIS